MGLAESTSSPSSCDNIFVVDYLKISTQHTAHLSMIEGVVACSRAMEKLLREFLRRVVCMQQPLVGASFSVCIDVPHPTPFSRSAYFFGLDSFIISHKIG